MRSHLSLLLLPAVLLLAACDGGTVSGPVTAADRDLENQLNRIEAKLIEENRTIRDELKKVILLQQETSRTHLEEVSEDLQFQVGKMLQRIGRLETRVLELMDMVEKGGGVPTAAEVLETKLFTPEMRKEIAAKVADRGITLKEDRLEVAGVIGPGRGAPLEYFAVLRGGKEHEALVVVTGSYGLEERLPRGLAAAINLACQALNLPRGTPARWREGGESTPATGEAIHMYVEWDEDGKTIRARAEDLVYNETANQAMAAGTWIYVGSRFLRNVGTGQSDFMAEVTGNIAASFGGENAIIANSSPEATDDNEGNFFRGYTPRCPPIETPVKLVISRHPLEANAVFED